MPRTTPPPPSASSWSRFGDLVLRDRSVGAAAAQAMATGQAVQPLTHHQIIEAVAPFARCGHALDLENSDRARRRLVFRGVQRAVVGNEGGMLALRETLQLDSPVPGHFALTRTVLDAEGSRATLHSAGSAPGELLRSVQAVPLQWHFDRDTTICVVRSGCIPPGPAPDDAIRLTQVVARAADVALTVHVPSSTCSSKVSAGIELQVEGTATLLPPDLLAVLGWDWSMLEAGPVGRWHGSVRLRGDPAQRAVEAVNKLRSAMVHVLHTLSEPPARFHARLRVARFSALARHAIPALAFALLPLEALFADVLREERDSVWAPGLVCVPAAALLWFLLRSEPPRLALPRWPRPLSAQTW